MKTKKEETIELPTAMIDELTQHGNPRKLIITATKKHLDDMKKRSSTGSTARLKINSRGEIKLSKELMEQSNLHIGDKIKFVDNHDSTISIRKV